MKVGVTVLVELKWLMPLSKVLFHKREVNTPYLRCPQVVSTNAGLMPEWVRRIMDNREDLRVKEN